MVFTSFGGYEFSLGVFSPSKIEYSNLSSFNLYLLLSYQNNVLELNHQ